MCVFIIYEFYHSLKRSEKALKCNAKLFDINCQSHEIYKNIFCKNNDFSQQPVLSRTETVASTLDSALDKDDRDMLQGNFCFCGAAVQLQSMLTHNSRVLNLNTAFFAIKTLLVRQIMGHHLIKAYCPRKKQHRVLHLVSAKGRVVYGAAVRYFFCIAFRSRFKGAIS